MKHRKVYRIAVVATAFAVSCGGAMLHYQRTPAMFEAQACLTVSDENFAPLAQIWLNSDQHASSGSATLSTQLLGATSDLIKERSLELALSSPLESEVGELARCVSVNIEPQAGQHEIRLAYATKHRTDAVPALQAVVEAGLNLYRNNREAQPSSITAALEADRVKLDDEVEKQRQIVDELSGSQHESTPDETNRAVAFEKVKALGTASAEARRRRLESENRLMQAQRDVKSGLPVELILSRMPESEAKPLIRQLLTKSQLTDELTRLKADYQRLAVTFGHKHPRMVEMIARIKELHQQLETILTAIPEGSAESSPATLLLRSLESELSENRAYEQDILDQLAEEKTALDRYSELEASAQTAGKELIRLQQERDRLQQRLVAGREDLTQAVALIEPPKLLPEPTWPKLPYHLGAGAAVGFVLACGGLWILSRFKGARSQAPIVPESYLERRVGSLEERRLARLRAVSAG